MSSEQEPSELSHLIALLNAALDEADRLDLLAAAHIAHALDSVLGDKIVAPSSSSTHH